MSRDRSEQPCFVLDGSRFDDLEGFYDEVSRELMGGMARTFKHDDRDPRYWGRNLDAFNDILRGDMGRIPRSGRFTIVWKNSARSRDKLRAEFDVLLEIIQSHPGVTLRLE